MGRGHYLKNSLTTFVLYIIYTTEFPRPHINMAIWYLTIEEGVNSIPMF